MLSDVSEFEIMKIYVLDLLFFIINNTACCQHYCELKCLPLYFKELPIFHHTAN